jgi:hypothetical protein
VNSSASSSSIAPSTIARNAYTVPRPPTAMVPSYGPPGYHDFPVNGPGIGTITDYSDDGTIESVGMQKSVESKGAASRPIPKSIDLKSEQVESELVTIIPDCGNTRIMSSNFDVSRLHILIV